MKKVAQISSVLNKYIPIETVAYVAELFCDYPVNFKIVQPRKTKLGDFKASTSSDRLPQITINGDLNKYAFLITTIHEFAHLKTWIEHKRGVKPHGVEWKNNFILLMHPLILLNVLPKNIEVALLNSFTNVKASSCSDIQLNRVLMSYDEHADNQIILEKLPKYSTFAIGSKTFKKGELRRTRYMCAELNTGKKYLIYKLAKVEVINYE